MIIFEINSQGYYVEWGDLPYYTLYMIYYPVGNLKRIQNGRIEILPETRTFHTVPCHRMAGALKGSHSPSIPTGLYSVRLCTGPDGENSTTLVEKRVFIGQKVLVRYGLDAARGSQAGFQYMSIQSDCFIPRNNIWITCKAVSGDARNEDIDLGIKVLLPEMYEDEKGKYWTHCMMRESGYRFVRVEISPILADCVQTVRY